MHLQRIGCFYFLYNSKRIHNCVLTFLQPPFKTFSFVFRVAKVWRPGEARGMRRREGMLWERKLGIRKDALRGQGEPTRSLDTRGLGKTDDGRLAQHPPSRRFFIPLHPSIGGRREISRGRDPEFRRGRENCVKSVMFYDRTRFLFMHF